MSHYTEKTPPLSLPCSQELMEKTQAFCSLCDRAASAHDVAYLFLGSCALARSIAAKVFYVLFHNICLAALIGFCSCCLSELTEAGTRRAAGSLYNKFRGLFSLQEIAFAMKVSTKTVARGSSEMLAQSAEQASNESQDAPTDEHDTLTPLELSQTPKIEPTQANCATLKADVVSAPATALAQTKSLKKAKLKTKTGASRIRRAGGGRKPKNEYDGVILEAIHSQECYGDPQNSDCLHCPYYNCSSLLQHVRQTTRNPHLSRKWLRSRLRVLKITLKRNRKLEQVGESHIDRDVQFVSKIMPLKKAARLAQAVWRAYETPGAETMISRPLFQHLSMINPFTYGFDRVSEGLDILLSIDTKKKELIGNYAQDGQSFNEVKTLDHDFGHTITTPEGNDVIEKAAPVGIYDCGRNFGFIGLTHRDNPEFVVKNIGKWFREFGRFQYPFAKNIHIMCDCGGSNSARGRAFKLHLSELANEIGINIVVHHCPPGCSKYNSIEHLLFNHCTRAMRAHPLLNFDVFADLLNSVETATGLKVHAYVAEQCLEDWCKPTEPVSDEVMASIDIEFCAPRNAQKPEESKRWNYTIRPKVRRTVKFDSYLQYQHFCQKFGH